MINFKLILLWCAACLAGCASSTVQTDALSNSAVSFKPSINNIAPYIEQDVGHCGPATLAMAIAATGNSHNIDEITSQVYSPNTKGSLQESMISAARRQGYLAIPITGFTSLLKELEAGNVVIVFENLGISWIPQWHYALVTGYNLKNKTLVMHSGPQPNQFIDMAEFELSWKLTNYWALVVLPPGEVSVSANEITQLQAAAALEKLAKYEDAKNAYLGILGHWPQSLIARIGLGNIFFNLKQYQTSIHYLKSAVELHPDSVEAKQNLRIVQQIYSKSL